MKKRFVYIAGEAHSGSTATDFLLGRFLGRSCGQLVDLGYSVRADGSLAKRTASDAISETWYDFLRNAPVQDRVDFRWIFDEIIHERNFWRYFLSAWQRREHARRFDRSIRSIYEFCACDTLIDSSKNATRALGVFNSEVCEAYVVHVIRSPAGFLTSIAKRDPNARSLRLQLFWTAHWVVKNLLAYLLKFHFADRYFRIEYNFLFSDPYLALQPVFSKLGVVHSQEEFARIFDEIRQEPETVGGNRIRGQGPLRLEHKSIGEAELRAIRLPVRVLCRALEWMTMDTSSRRSASPPVSAREPNRSADIP